MISAVQDIARAQCLTKILYHRHDAVLCERSISFSFHHRQPKFFLPSTTCSLTIPNNVVIEGDEENDDSFESLDALAPFDDTAAHLVSTMMKQQACLKTSDASVATSVETLSVDGAAIIAVQDLEQLPHHADVRRLVEEVKAVAVWDDNRHHRIQNNVEFLDSKRIVQFTGTVGIGSRSVRTRMPLPKPALLVENHDVSPSSRANQSSTSSASVSSLGDEATQSAVATNTPLSKKGKKRPVWKRLLHRQGDRRKDRNTSSNTSTTISSTRGVSSTTSTNIVSSSPFGTSPDSSFSWNPFVMPYQMPTGDKLCFTPRLVAYFEVILLPAKNAASATTPIEAAATAATTSSPALSEQRPESSSKELKKQSPEASSAIHKKKRPKADPISPPKARPPLARQYKCCVSVGLTVQGFALHRNMPGWESQSFGYHGDDGSIFANGKKVKRGPTFGVGDVVGCGIDYRCSNNRPRVFYTCNGKCLGYDDRAVLPIRATKTTATDDESSVFLDWYATVGLDSAEASVEYNLGIDKPFVYDLAAMTM